MFYNLINELTGSREARKAIIIGIFMTALEQFSGCYTLLFYTASVFDKAGATTIKPELATILVGAIQLIGAFISTTLVDRLGRKPLLVYSTLTASIGMAIFAIVTELIQKGNDSALFRFIPVAALSLSIFVANIGIFSLTFVILSEISPPKVSHIECA